MSGFNSPENIRPPIIYATSHYTDFEIARKGLIHVIDRVKYEGVKGLFSREKHKGERLSVRPYEARVWNPAKGDFDRSEFLTKRNQRKRERDARKEYEEFSFFNFEDKSNFIEERPYLKREYEKIERLSKEHLKAKLRRLKLPYEYVDRLNVIYATASEENGGYVTDAGQIIVNVDPREKVFTGLVIPHELSHGASPVIDIFSSRGESQIAGLRRYNGAGELMQDILDNSTCVWDEADVYHMMKKKNILGVAAPFGNEDQVHYEQNTRESTGNADIQVAKDAVDLAKRQGMPDELLEPFIYNLHDLQQIIVVWRVARLLGESISSPSEFGNTNLMIQKGRDMLDIDKFSGTSYSLDKLFEIFEGKDRDTILHADQHPDDFMDVLHAIDRAEERMGIPKRLAR